MLGFNGRRAVTLRRRLSISCIVFAALTTATSAAHSTDCQSEKGAGYPWAWREIDGKRCWYKGTPGMDKKLLRWAEAPAAPAAPKNAATPKRPSSIIGDYAEHERLLYTYWPLWPPLDVSNERPGTPRAKRL